MSSALRKSDAAGLMPWECRMTGNMTLSVVGEGGLRILTVDMLAQDTMKHDTNGDRLARALNDLTRIAAPPSPLPHPDAGLSPTPWSLTADAIRRRIAVRDAGGRLIAGHKFGRTVSDAVLREIVVRLEAGIRAVNGTPWT